MPVSSSPFVAIYILTSYQVPAVSTGPVKGSCLVGITAQAGDPWAWHLSVGQALELGRRPGLAWAGGPHTGDGVL